MKRRVARAFEGVYMSALFLRGLRFSRSTVAAGTTVVSLTGGTPHQWTELIGAINKAEIAKADVEVTECFDDNGKPRGRRIPKDWPGLRLPRARSEPPPAVAPEPPRVQIPRERLIVRLRLDA